MDTNDLTLGGGWPLVCLDDPREWIRYKGTLEYICTLILQAKGHGVESTSVANTWRFKSPLVNQTTYTYVRLCPLKKMLDMRLEYMESNFNTTVVRL